MQKNTRVELVYRKYLLEIEHHKKNMLYTYCSY